MSISTIRYCSGPLSATTIIQAGRRAPLCAEIVFQIGFRVAKRHVVLLEERVHVEASLKVKEPTDLCLRQGSGPIALNRDRLERPMVGEGRFR